MTNLSMQPMKRWSVPGSTLLEITLEADTTADVARNLTAWHGQRGNVIALNVCENNSRHLLLGGAAVAASTPNEMPHLLRQSQAASIVRTWSRPDFIRKIESIAQHLLLVKLSPSVLSNLESLKAVIESSTCASMGTVILAVPVPEAILESELTRVQESKPSTTALGRDCNVEDFRGRQHLGFWQVCCYVIAKDAKLLEAVRSTVECEVAFSVLELRECLRELSMPYAQSSTRLHDGLLQTFQSLAPMDSSMLANAIC